MFTISKNTRVTLKRGRGIFEILFIRWNGLFWNIIKERVSFAKRARESGLLIKKKKG